MGNLLSKSPSCDDAFFDLRDYSLSYFIPLSESYKVLNMTYQLSDYSTEGAMRYILFKNMMEKPEMWTDSKSFALNMMKVFKIDPIDFNFEIDIIVRNHLAYFALSKLTLDAKDQGKPVATIRIWFDLYVATALNDCDDCVTYVGGEEVKHIRSDKFIVKQLYERTKNRVFSPEHF